MNRRRFLLSALAAPVVGVAGIGAFVRKPGLIYEGDPVMSAISPMPMPYKPLDGAFVEFVKSLEASARKIGASSPNAA